MSVKYRVGVMFASACLFGVLASRAVLAQAALDEDAVLLLPGIETAADGSETLPDPDLAPDVAVPGPAVDVTAPAADSGVSTADPEAAEPARATMAVPLPGEETGYEYQNDDELVENAARTTQHVGDIDASIADANDNGNCDGLCSNYLIYLNEERDMYQNIADRMYEEIRRRQPVVVVTPDNAPDTGPDTTPKPILVAVPAGGSARLGKADVTPPPGYCAALVASGDRSDCGWRFKQAQKP